VVVSVTSLRRGKVSGFFETCNQTDELRLDERHGVD
jgi:hypothetical protein